VHRDQPRPDALADGYGFSLYSRRLVNLLGAFNIAADVFPVQMVDEDHRPLAELEYSVFHLVEPIVDAMDDEKSGWVDFDAGLPRLVLKDGGFEERSILMCDRSWIQLMRDDLHQKIKQLGITGFEFINPLDYRIGPYVSYK